MLPPYIRKAQPKPYRFLASTTSMVIDGNSLVANAHSSDAAHGLAGLLGGGMAPINGQFAIGNRGAGSQTINNMRGLTEASQNAPNTSSGLGGSSAADVDAAWVAGKANFLLLWEGTNSIYGAGWTGLQAAAQLALYIAERKAVHPWRVIVIGTLPRFASPYGRTNAQGNAELIAYDNYIAANLASMGIEAFVPLRGAAVPDSPFNLVGYDTIDKFETPALWGVQGVGGMWSLQDNANNAAPASHTHLQDDGFAWIAGRTASVLRNLKPSP